ncbi:MAG TPA: cation:proton antiporter [Jatrophihabitans sp.]|nr:cation:proton antiporter [Jatrophihabitans sp.]
MSHNASLQGLLHVSAALLLIVVSAQLCGRLARLCRQPAVLGEMICGVLLGPTLLGAVAPELGGYLFNAGSRSTLYAISMIGLSLYMFLVGLQHDHRGSQSRERTLPYLLAAVGIAGPLVVGGATALTVLSKFRPAGVSKLVFALFVGGALAVTAFPMLARVLEERKIAHTRFGVLATTAAAVDDALAWCLLAIVAALATDGSVIGALRTLIPAICMVIGLFALLPRVLRRPMQRAAAQGHISDQLFVTVLGIVLAVGWLSDYIGIYSVFGGFICGVAMPKVAGFTDRFVTMTSAVVRCLLLPIFFAYSGLNTDLRGMLDVRRLVPLLVLVLVAVLSKSLTAYGVLRGIYRWPHHRAAAMGALMNSRGLMILIFINAGLSMKLIPQSLFSMLVVVAVVTTGLAVPAYRHYVSDEQERQDRLEALAEASAPARLGHPDQPHSPAPKQPAALTATHQASERTA